MVAQIDSKTIGQETPVMPHQFLSFDRNQMPISSVINGTHLRTTLISLYKKCQCDAMQDLTQILLLLVSIIQRFHKDMGEGREMIITGSITGKGDTTKYVLLL